MSNISYFPGCDPSRVAAPEVIADFHRRRSLEEMREVFLSDEEALARTPTEEDLLPFYGKAAERSLHFPFTVRAKLNFQGEVMRLVLPNGRAFAPDWQKLVQAASHGALCHGRVITKATWVGPQDNEPWAGLENASGFARSALLNLCRVLAANGANLKLVKHLQFSFRTQECEPNDEINCLELTLALAE